jgi:hypothetical protein
MVTRAGATLENSVKAKFAEYLFHALGCIKTLSPVEWRRERLGEVHQAMAGDGSQQRKPDFKRAGW